MGSEGKPNKGWQYLYVEGGVYTSTGTEIATSDRNKKHEITSLSEAYS
jgi:hypothetical protein